MIAVSQVVAGALYDFMGRLTTGEDEITLSGHHEPHRLLEIFKAWAEERGLSDDGAAVRDWQSCLVDHAIIDTRLQVEPPERELT